MRVLVWNNVMEVPQRRDMRAGHPAGCLHSLRDALPHIGTWPGNYEKTRKYIKEL